MKILNSEQMREIDRKAIEEIGIPGVVLMENAGRNTYHEIVKRIPHIQKKKVSILCGKGNNGGDGFVICRYLLKSGNSPRVYLFAKKEELRGDAKINFEIIDKMRANIIEIIDKNQWRKEKDIIFNSDVIIDALFGTGLKSELGNFWREVFDCLKDSPAFKVSVDIPSGLSSDTFLLQGPCFKADLTVTMAALKIPHVFSPASEYAGEVVVADIGVPDFLFDKEDYFLELTDLNAIKRGKLFLKRKMNSHKGDYGHLLIVAGSLGKTGAAVMAGRSALKIGAGLVTIAAPKSCIPIIASSCEEIMTYPAEETEEGTISENSFENILEFSKDKDVCVIGPGLSTNPSTCSLVLKLLEKIETPLIVDADGLNCLSLKMQELKNRKSATVLTPHPGEMARILKLSAKKILDNRISIVRDYCLQNRLYLVLKGWRTLIGSNDGKVYVNPTGNPGMATAGSGDVLSGIIGGILAQGEDILNALIKGVYIHGLCGDLAAKKFGEKSLIAGDIIDCIPEAIKEIES
ncbi:MAG: NAD(P)H-hydrate dehydratase [Acidobacteriota bacterium]